MNESIPLSQKLYLLAIHPEKGGVISATLSAINFALIGSVFLELLQNKNIRFENKRIVVLNSKSENELHRFFLEKLSSSSKNLRISAWINKFNLLGNRIVKLVQKDLSTKRYIRMEPKKFLFIKWEKPFLSKKEIVYQLITEIKRQIFIESVTEDEMILLSFLKPSGLLRRIFPERDKRKKAIQKLNKMMIDNQVSTAVTDVIYASQAVAASLAATSAVS